MKKIIALLMVLAMVFALVACTAKPAEQGDAKVEYKVAMVTDYGDITDESFNQATYEGCKEFCEANKVEFTYKKPSGDSTAERVSAVEAAIDEGYNVIVMPGFAFAGTIYEVQDKYPEVKFIGLDVSEYDITDCFYNHDEEGNWTTLIDEANQPHVAANTYCAVYQEELCGYMAGFAAVKLGYKHLGFLGGMAVPAVVRYGYGFVQGANMAAEEMGIADQVSIKYWYCGGFAPTDDIKIKMAGWFTDGTEVVFACGGGIYLSAVAAATEANGKVIGVDVDQSAESDCIITSAMKGLTNSVVLALEDLKANNGKWSADYAGKTAVLGAADDCVGLPTAAGSWRLSAFTVDEYNALFEKVKNGEIAISNVTDVEPTVTITVDYNA